MARASFIMAWAMSNCRSAFPSFDSSISGMMPT
jgi:hypothetical protein